MDAYYFCFKKENVDQLSQLMVTGCSLGQSVSIEAEGDGGISVWKKGINGVFRASNEEIHQL
ncbi:hypothetical protein [Methylomagnum sp.]